jgi:hypothetical protein
VRLLLFLFLLLVLKNYFWATTFHHVFFDFLFALIHNFNEIAFYKIYLNICRVCNFFFKSFYLLFLSKQIFFYACEFSLLLMIYLLQLIKLFFHVQISWLLQVFHLNFKKVQVNSTFYLAN